MSNVSAGKDTDDDGEKLNDVEKALDKLGIKLRNSNKEWRNFEEVLDEVADKWDTFAETERSQIATAIAGTRQQETFRALMNNYDMVSDLAKVAAESTGSASDKMNTYLDSVEAKTNELKATWEQFVLSLGQSDGYKSFLDLCQWLLNNIPTLLGYGTSILTFIVAIKAQKIVDGIFGLTENIKNLFVGTTGLITNFTTLTGVLTGHIAVVKKDTLAKIENIAADNAMDIIQKKHLIAKQLINAGWSAETAFMKVNSMEKQGQIVVTKGLTTASTALAASLSAVTLALTAGIAIVTIATQAYQKHQQALMDTADEANNAVDEEIDSYKSLSKNIDSLTGRYKDIQKSTKTLAERKTDLKGVQKELIDLFGKEASGIDLVNGKYEEQIQKLKELKANQIEETVKNSAYEHQKGEDARNEFLGTEVSSIIAESDGMKSLFKVIKKLKKSGNTEEFFNKYRNAKTNEERDNLIDDYGLKKFRDFFDEWMSTEQDIESFGTALLNVTDIMDKYGIDFDTNNKGDVFLTGTDKEGLAKYVKEVSELGKDATNSTERKFYSGLSTGKAEGMSSLVYKGVDEEDLGKALEYIEANEQQKIEELFSNDKGNMENLKNAVGAMVDTESLMNDDRQKSEKADEVQEWQKEYLEAQTDLIFALKAIYKSAEEKGIDKETINNYLNSLGLNPSLLNENAGMLTSKPLYVEERHYAHNDDGSVATDYSGIDTEGKYGIAGEEYFNGVSAPFQELVGFKEYKNVEEAKEALKEMSETDFTQLLKQLELISDEEETINEHADGYEADDYNIKASVGTDEEFFKMTDKLEDWQGYYDSVKDGGKLTAEELDDLSKYSSKIAEKITNGTEVTADDIKELIGDTTENINDDLDKMQDIFTDATDYIDEAVKKADWGDTFVDKVNEAYDKAVDAISKGEKLDFELNPTVATDTGALTDLAQQLESLEEDYGTGKTSADDYRAGLFDLFMEMASTGEQANLLSSLIGEENGLAGYFNTLDADQTNALISLLGFNSAEEASQADSATLQSVLGTLGGKWNELDQDQQFALGSLLNYINTYNKSPDIVKSLLVKAIGTVKAQAYTGSINTGIRKAQTKSAATPKKSSGSKGSKNNYSAEDAANDLKDILNDIEKYEEDIELDLEDQTEQFINQEMLAANRLDTLKEELDYYNDIYDVTENTSKWLETQNKLLDNQSKKVGSLQNAQASIDAQRKKLIKQNSNYNVESWFDSEGNDTLAYGDLINSFEYKKEAIERDTAAKMRAVYNRVSGSKDKDTIKDAKDEIKRIEEEADIKIKALDKEQEKVEKIHDSVGELNDAWKDNQEAIRDALKELHDLVKSMRDELLDDITEQLEKAVDRTNKSLEKSVTRMEQLVTIQEKSNDILNETIDTQQELDSELQASLDSFEYLDEQMRELMFNEDDYKVLSETLTGIQEDVASIWEDHYKQIDELTDDTMYKAEYITAETERQLDMKMREYELAKAELDVAKARTNLQNVKNERNVRMFVGGQWIWTADPNAVKDAQQQLADAEREKTRIEREAEQQRLLDKMNKMIDSDNLQIDENNELLERIQEAIEEQTTEVKSIEDALANASGQDLPALNDVLQGAFGKDGGDFKEIMTNLNKGQTALAAALDGKTTEQAEAQLKRNDMSKSEFEALVKKLGYGWDEKTGTVTTWDGSFKAHYKGWKDTSKPNAPLGTGSNGASVTGGGANGGSSGGGNSGGGGNNQPTSTKSLDAIAKEVIRGKWGNGTERRRRLTAAGYDYNAVQSVVNQLKRQGYFDLGGLATGKGILLKDVKSPERVLSPQQTKSFDRLVDNLTSNPVLQALTKNVKGTSSLKGLVGGSGETKQYYFSNFTVKADNLTEFIDSLEGMIPITNK